MSRAKIASYYYNLGRQKAAQDMLGGRTKTAAKISPAMLKRLGIGAGVGAGVGGGAYGINKLLAARAAAAGLGRGPLKELEMVGPLRTIDPLGEIASLTGGGGKFGPESLLAKFGPEDLLKNENYYLGKLDEIEKWHRQRLEDAIARNDIDKAMEQIRALGGGGGGGGVGVGKFGPSSLMDSISHLSVPNVGLSIKNKVPLFNEGLRMPRSFDPHYYIEDALPMEAAEKFDALMSGSPSSIGRMLSSSKDPEFAANLLGL